MPWYLISNFGRVFHRYLNDFLTINIDSKGYSYKPLATTTGKQAIVRIHRVELMEFNYQVGCEFLLVNHKDGNKLNNIISNLEWATYSENNKHAYDVLNVGRIHSCKYSDENLIKAICEDLQKGLMFKDIATKYNVSIDLVESIFYKRAHKEYSKDYIFIPRKSKLSDYQIEQICSFFSSNINPDKPSISANFCISALKFINYNNKIDRNMIESIANIYRRKVFKQISNKYKW